MSLIKIGLKCDFTIKKRCQKRIYDGRWVWHPINFSLFFFPTQLMNLRIKVLSLRISSLTLFVYCRFFRVRTSVSFFFWIQSLKSSWESCFNRYKKSCYIFIHLEKYLLNEWGQSYKIRNPVFPSEVWIICKSTKSYTKYNKFKCC